jgi:hypothetical protein
VTPIPGIPTWRPGTEHSWLSNMCSRIAIGPTIPDERRVPGREVLDLVSAADGRTHRVVERAYGDALARRTGRCVALCAHVVVLCALTTPPGPRCRACAARP